MQDRILPPMSGAPLRPSEAAAEADLWSHIDRRIVTLATAAAALFYLILTIGGVVTGDSNLLAQSVSPAIVGGSGLVMLALGKPVPLVQIGLGVAGLLIYVSISPDDLPGNPLIGLLIMAIVAAALGHHHVMLIGSVAIATLGITGYLWHAEGTSSADRVVMSFSLIAAYVIIGWLLGYLRSQSRVARSKLHTLLASKDQFLATVSHELRTPVTTVVGLTSELRDRWDEFTQAELDEFMRMMADSSSDIADLIEDLLVARADIFEIQIHKRDIGLLEAIEPVLAEPMNRSIDLSKCPQVSVVADPLRVRQVIRNLLTNAKRYGGTSIRMTATCTESWAAIDVRDDGAPIPLAERDEIFEPYHRSGKIEGVPGSFGIGLTVARRLARLMDGDLTYDHDGSEAIFTLTLPLAVVPVSVA
ncbi:MAG: HAMP domain-containing histidine kinase [Acidimicrobiia bacterium]|nr:HAMP domain-containing histidine kinase [Acidimicrobiia bacterium]NNC75605.1 HAMP domain-containing histidine kinase [Acidimicrobiia bacterium]